MGLWQRFVAWIFAPTRRKRADTDTPIEFDEDAIAEELQLLLEARRLGEAGQPAPNATLPPGIEARVVHRIDKARLSHIEWAARRLVVLNADLARLDVTALVGGALQADKEFARKADTSLNERRNLLAALGEKAHRARESLEKFRQGNGLTRNPHYPEGVGQLVRVGFLLVFIAVEAVLNSTLFATGTDNGLIGGFLYAATLAFVNVFVACLFGMYVVREVFHRRIVRKIGGYLGLALALSTMVGISLGIAHFRDALVADVEAPSKAALVVLRQSPLALADMSSWLLFSVSLLFAGLALADGLSLDDLYPGYGRHAREDADAEDAYQKEIQGLRADLDELKEEFLKRLDEDTKSAQASVARQEGLLEQKEKTLSRLDAAMFNARSCMEALITRFRDENEMHRKGLPVPASFSVMPTLKELVLPDFKIEVGRGALAAQQDCLRELVAGLQPVKAVIQAGFTEKFDALLSLEEQFTPTDVRLPTSLPVMTA